MMHDGEDKSYATRMALRTMNMKHCKKKTRGAKGWLLFVAKNKTTLLATFYCKKKKGTKAPICYKKKRSLIPFY
jgi:hypothetical protein